MTDTQLTEDELEEEFYRLQEEVGPVTISDYCPLHRTVRIRHNRTRIVVVSRPLPSPMASAVDALWQLSWSLCN